MDEKVWRDVWQARINGSPDAAGVGGLEDLAAVRPSVQRVWGRGIDGQGADRRASWQFRIGGGPGGAGVSGLEDPVAVRPGVERAGGRGVDGQGLNVQVRQSRDGPTFRSATASIPWIRPEP